MEVKYEWRVAQSIRRWCANHSNVVVEVCRYDNRDPALYDALLRGGWRKSDDFVHTLFGDSASDLIAQLKDVAPCDCDECSEE